MALTNAKKEAVEGHAYDAWFALREIAAYAREFLTETDLENISQVTCLLQAIKQGRVDDVLGGPEGGG